MSAPSTLYDKVFADHVVSKTGDTYLIYIDRHLVHEVTSPQAFEGLRNAGRPVRRLDCTLATVDHNIPTTSRKTYKNISTFIKEDDSRLQCTTLEKNVKDFGVRYFGLDDNRQGIVHVVGPEQGFTLPGTTVVCGDSHTSTHGAFGALAFGIGTSEVEHVLATQTIIQSKSKNMKVEVSGKLSTGITSKDLILHIIGQIGTAGGTGAVIEFCGDAIRDLSIEARMSMCNMAIEGGARAGMIAPDEKTLAYVKGRPLAPKGEEWEKAVAYWKTLKSDPGAKWDIEVNIRAEDVIPTVTWGTSPEAALPITGKVPNPADYEGNPTKKASIERALKYMGLEPDVPLQDIAIDKVFIGSCTNSRIEDLRTAAAIVKGRHIADNIKAAMIVPGSGLVKRKAEKEGLDKIFEAAGFEWREPGCSMCLGMNPDILQPHERCASTSNRNFEGRQGALSRTHLCSPAMAAAAALKGKLADVREYLPKEFASLKISSNDEDDKKAAAETPIQSHATESTEAVETETDSSEKAAAAGGMPKFGVETGIAAHIPVANIDTDAIIPKQFLKTIKRTGLSAGLFYEWRFNPDGSKTEFILNKPVYDHSKILVISGDNFGCGSSREHAPWALADFGIRAVVAPSFGDIFYNNSLKNGLLPIKLDADIIKSKLVPIAEAGKELSIDLPNQCIKYGDEKLAEFTIDAFNKDCLVNGLDEIALTLHKDDEIKKYEAKRSDKFSFLESENGAPLKNSKAAGKLGQDW